MKHIKTLLAIATVALLGSSAWAADIPVLGTDTVKVNKETKTFSYSYPGGARWFKLTPVNSGDTSLTPKFVKAHTTRQDLSDGALGTVEFSFVGNEVKAPAVWRLWRCSANGDKVPNFDNNSQPYSGDQRNKWAETGDFEITVLPEDAVVPEDAAVIVGDTTKKTLTSETSASWTATVTEGGDYISVIDETATGTEFTFRIGGTAKGTGVVSVKKDGKEVALYNVKTFTDEETIHLCLGDTLTLNYNNAKATCWNLVNAGGTFVNTAGSGGQGNHGGEGTANPTDYSYKLVLGAIAEGAETVKLRYSTDSGTIWNDWCELMVKVLQPRTAMAQAAFEVACPLTGKSEGAGSATWMTPAVEPSGKAEVTYVSQAANGATVSITGASAGDAVITVGNVQGSNNNLSGAEFALAVNFLPPKQTEDGEAQYVRSGATATLDDKTWASGWTAQSLKEDVATVTASGAEGTSPVVTGEGSGIAEIWVEDANVRRIYQVHVQSERSADVKAYLDSTVSPVTCGSGAAAEWTATSADEDVATVFVPSGASDSVKPQITGVSKGTTTITVQNAYCIWTLNVTVEDAPPAKLWEIILRGSTGNAEIDSDSDPKALILTYKTSDNTTLNDTFKIPGGYCATVDILAVGGGGGGGGAYRSSNSSRYGNGGNGGSVAKAPRPLTENQVLNITVGKGGTAGNASAQNAKGGDGENSTVSSSTGNFETITGAKGTGGNGGVQTSGQPGANGSGADDTYGKGGAKNDNSLTTDGAAGEAGTGQGGQGGGVSQSGQTYTAHKGGVGGSGVVIIKVTLLKALASGSAQNIVKGDEPTAIEDYAWTTAWTAKSLDGSVATVTSSGAAGENPVVTGLKSGKTEIWVESDTIRRVYEVNVTETRTDERAMMKGDKVTITCSAGAAGTWTATSDNERAATVTIPAGSAGDSVVATITANHKGTAKVTVSNAYVTYEITVTVSVIKPEEITPVVVTATRARFTANRVKDSDEQYDGFLTEKGCRYAWGDNDELLDGEDWSEPSDGTPFPIATKPTGATQLFVKRPTE